MVFLCWVVCVCLSVSAWPGCLSLPLDAGRGQQLPTLDDPDTTKTAHRTQAQVNSNLLVPDYNTLLPLLRLPQDPHSISLWPIREGREVYHELSNGADSSTDSSSAVTSLLEALQQQGLTGPADATGVDLQYEVVDPRLMALLDDLMTQQQRHSQIALVDVDNFTFKISRSGNTARKDYQIQMSSNNISKDNIQQPLELINLISQPSVGNLENPTYQSKGTTEIGNPKVSNAMIKKTKSMTENINSRHVKFDVIDAEAETRSSDMYETWQASSDAKEILKPINRTEQNRDSSPSKIINRVKRSSTTLSIDYSLKILRDTLLQELKRKKKQRILLRRLRENQQQLMNIG